MCGKQKFILNRHYLKSAPLAGTLRTLILIHYCTTENKEEPIFPACFSVLCWILWAAFLLTPSLFGLHYAPMFSTANNVVFVLMGFVLCSAVSVAIRAGHGMRAVFFGLGIFLLPFWF